MISKAIKNGVAGYPLDMIVADLEYAAGNCEAAFARYSAIIPASEDKSKVVERAGISALKCGRNADAEAFLRAAVADERAGWSAWNALGVLLDRKRDWAAADQAYQRALSLDPANADVLNNLGWSLILRRDWAKAERTLQRAASLNPKAIRIKHNLQLARAGISNDLPKREVGESIDSWSARLNDAGVVAYSQGNFVKARAAFTRALEARDQWFDRAANNLDLTEKIP